MQTSDGSGANIELPPEPAIIDTAMPTDHSSSSIKIVPEARDTQESPLDAEQRHTKMMQLKNKQKLQQMAQLSASKKNKLGKQEGSQSGKNIPDKTTASSKNIDDSSKRQKQPRFSIFDQLEEFQFQSYEMGSKLKSLVDVIVLQPTSEDGFIDGMKAVPPSEWTQIRTYSIEANSVFESMQTALGNFFERMQEEITKWKRRCGRLQYKLQHYQNYPASGGSHTRKSGTNKTNHEAENSARPQKLILSGSVRRIQQGTDDEPVPVNPSSPYEVTQTKDRRLSRQKRGKDAYQNGTGNLLAAHGAKHSLSSSCHPPSGAARAGGKTEYLKLTQQQNKMLQQSWLDIATVYDKNRTQMNSFMDEMELAVHELKQAREKLNVKHLGTMTTVEQEMEALLQDITTARSQRSHHSQATNGGGIIKSHRSSHRQSRSHLLLNANSAKVSQRQQNSSVITPQKSKQIASTKPLQMQAQQQSANLLHNNSLATSGNITVLSESKKQRGKSHSVMPSGQSSVQHHSYQNEHNDSILDSPINQQKSHSKGLVPPLPIHMINNSNHGSQPSQPQQQSQRPPHSGRNSSKPPQPESFRRQQSQRSNRSRHSGQFSARNNQERQKSRANSQRSSNKNLVNSHNVSGAIVEGALINPLMVGAAAGNLSSRFDNQLESDYDKECDATLMFDTERLKQFPEEYAMLSGIKEEDKKILIKQVLFMKYEKEIKRQLKQEKLQRHQQKKLAQQMRSRQEYQSGSANTYQNPPGHNRSRLGSNASSSYQQNQNRQYNSSNGGQTAKNNQQSEKQNGNERDIKLHQILDVSGIQLESSLSQIGTQEVQNNLIGKNCEMEDAKLSQLLAVDHEISGLLTVTQKELIEMVDKDLKLQAEIRCENRKVLDWSSNDEESKKEPPPPKHHRNQGTLHKPSSEAQLQVDTSDLLVQRDPSSDSVSEKEKTSARHYRNNNYQSGADASSFQNDSSFFEDQATPPVMISRQQHFNQEQVPEEVLRPRPHTEMAGPVPERDQIEIIDNMMAQGDDESYDENDDDSYFARQKKSLEIITERQSEFSNTNGTSARPGSHRSKMSSKFVHGGGTNNSSVQNNKQPQQQANNSNSGKKTKNGKPPAVGNYVTNQVQASAEYILLNAAQPTPAAKQRYSYQTAYGRSDVNSISGEQEPSEMGINPGASMASSAQRNRRQGEAQDDQQSYVDTSFIEEGQTDDQNSSKIGRRMHAGSSLGMQNHHTPDHRMMLNLPVYSAQEQEEELSPHRRIFRSNSEVYLKPVDNMQDTDDAFLMPISYAAADVTEGQSDYQNEPAPVQTMIMIDSSQMNNLMTANAADYLQSSFNNIVNSSVCLRLQRLFMQAQLSASRGQAKTQFALKASVGTTGSNHMNPLSKTPSQLQPPDSKHAATGTHQHPPALVGANFFTRSNSLSIQQNNAPQHVHRKTIQTMLSSGYYSHSALQASLQNQQQVISAAYAQPWLHHNHNQAAGLLFSSSLAPKGAMVGRTVSGSANVVHYARGGQDYSSRMQNNQTASGRGGGATTNTTSSLIAKLAAESQLASQPTLITDSDQRRKSADEPKHYRTHQNHGQQMSSLEEKRSQTSLGTNSSLQQRQQLLKLKTNNYHTLGGGAKQLMIQNQQSNSTSAVNRIKPPKMLNIAARKESSSGRGHSANARESVSPLNYQNISNNQSSQKVPALLNKSTDTSRSTGVIKKIRKIPVRRILDAQQPAARNNVQNISIQSLSNNIGGSLSHQSISTQKQQQQPSKSALDKNHKMQSELIQQFLSHQKAQIVNQKSNQSSVVTTPSAARTDSNKGGVATLLQKKSLKHRNQGVQQQQSHTREKSYDNQKRGNQITPRKQGGVGVSSFDRNSTPYQHSEQQEYANSMAQMLFKQARK